ncbi:PPOX class probable F420-dependent enzyme [Pseudonocardia hierapolitana]|uniref:PPOX class probable F420-dependent enzyme n=1 Tax=Pseudonocardia hierapolitana TaxID=1128676 RepID=A0A561SP95_9PSEU|nr:PPOX class F420-dependent oxidoreductase [Pseudonocardia hierapolitana]TWF76692.1 PPOX class probable F420-dependent enzyme [Pseudonocardia hierapolitana]
MAEIPEVFHDLLRSRAVAFVSTLGRSGAPQVTPLWFLWDGDRVRISLVEGRQKLRNLRRDPRIAVAIADPASPTFYLELRGVVSELVPDPGLELERAIAEKYTGGWEDVEPPGTTRYATSVIVERTTSQLGH